MLKVSRIVAVASLFATLSAVLTGCPQNGGQGSIPGQSYAIAYITKGFRITELESGEYFVSGVAKSDSSDYWRAFSAYFSSERQFLGADTEGTPFAVEDSSGPDLAIPIPGGGILVAGLTEALDGPNYDASRLVVERWDIAGELMWRRTYGDRVLAPFDMVALDATKAQLLLQDRNYSVVHGSSIMTLDLETGDELSTWDLSGPFNKSMCLLHAQNGDTVVASLGYLEVDTGLGVVVHRIGATGDVKWIRRIDVDTVKKDTPHNISEAPNGDLLFAVEGVDLSAIVRLTSGGDIVWIRNDFLDPDSGNQRDSVWDMVAYSDGMIGVTGTERTVEYIAQTIPVIRESSFVALLDGEGGRVWKKNFSDVNLYGICRTMQDTLVAVGTTLDGKLHIIEIDENGALVD